MTSKSGVLYCVGNVLKTYVNENGHRTIVPDTVGVDCSGFVGSTCGISTKLNCDDLAEYGHEVDFAEIQPFDIIIEDIDRDGLNDHCYFYKSEDSENSDKIIVWDCTTTAGTKQKTDERSILKTVYNRSIILRPYYTFEITVTHHRYYCTHPDCAGTSNAESSAWAAHDWEVPDASKPCERYCKVCNYSDTSLHAFTYLATSATSHTRTCTVCGYSDTVDHTFTYTSISGTQHTKTCTECGYSVTESHGGPCIAISPTQHVNPCMACGHSSTANHTFSYAYSSGGHTATCTGCGYSVTATHSLTNDSYTINGHTRVCTCGYSVTESHTLSFRYNIDKHWQECSVCDYETLPLNHNFVNGRCSVCNAYHGIIAALPPEDEPLPGPEDQKATLSPHRTKRGRVIRLGLLRSL